MESVENAGASCLFRLGEEKAHSIQTLFKYFCYHLHRGEWELSKACIDQLNAEGKYADVNIKDVLLDVIQFPFSRSETGTNIRSPLHLSWLCLMKYRTLKNTEEKDFELLHKDVEFSLILFDACEWIPATILKELYQYHQNVLQLESRGTAQARSPRVVTTQLLQTLLSILLQNPVLGNRLIQSLHANSDHEQYKKNNKVLQLLYIKAIGSILDKISQPLHQVPEAGEKVAEGGEENTVSSQDDNQQTLYQILSLFNPQTYENYSEIREVFGRFLELSCGERPILDRKFLLSCLIGAENNYLVQEFLKLEHEVYVKTCSFPSNLRDVDATEETRVMLKISKEENTEEGMHQLFLMCYTNKEHFLNVVVNTAVLLIKHGLFEELGQLLSSGMFDHLRPFLLLHGWSYCQTCAQAKLLLDTLKNEQWKSSHPVLESACNKLSYQIDLIKWCLDRTKPLLPAAEKGQVSSNQRAADMFTGLENHSVLYVLHQSTRLASLEQQEVLNLLEKSPLQKNPESTKSVRFETDKEKDEFHIERWRDISIYTGYCAIKNVMDAVYFCAECVHEKLVHPVQESNSVSPLEHMISSMSSSDSGTSESGYNFQEEYSKNVTQKLSSAKVYLSKLQPLNFRVEILENIFSLLFLSHEEIQESSAIFDSDSETGEEDERGRSETIVSNHPSLSQSILSEGSTSSPSQSVDEKITGEDLTGVGQILIGSYDEPFVETVPDVKTKKRERSASQDNSRSVYLQRLNSLKEKLAHQKGGSGNGSTLSTGSTSSCRKFGFLCNEYLVRDILALLKECLVDLSSAKFQILGNKEMPGKATKTVIDVSLEEPLSRLVQSSVGRDTLQRHVSQLQQFVSEAQWRFQLVCHEMIPRTPGVVLAKPLSFSLEENDDELAFLLQQKNGATKRTRRISSSLKDPRDEDSKLDRKSRRRQHRSVNHVFEVIKLLRLDDTPQAKEVKFAELFSKCSKKLQQLPSGQSQAVKPGKLSMKGLASVAAAGVATVSVNSVAEEILSEKGLPTIPCPKSRHVIPVKYSELFDQNNVHMMILFDMLCTSCKSWETCNSLIDIIKSKFKIKPQKGTVSNGEEKKKFDHRIQGIPSLIIKFESLLQLGGDMDLTTTLSHKETLSMLYKHSIQTFLQTATLPLLRDDCLTYAVMLIEMKKVIDKTEHAFQQHGKMPLEGYIHKPQRGSSEFSPSKVSPRTSPQTSPRPSPKSEDPTQTDKPVLHNAMKHLIHVMQKEVPKGGMCTVMTRSPPSSSGSRDYLQHLYDHLKGLAFVVAETEAKASDSVITPKNYFHMLLEKVAKRLSLSLTQIIVQSCCTNIPSKLCLKEGIKRKVSERPSEKRLPSLPDGPEAVIRSILTRLLHLMKDVTTNTNPKGVFDISCAKRLIKLPEYRDIISGTKCFRELDLNLLKSREEKLCFYGNLQNLMFLHMCLDDIDKSTSNTEDLDEKIYCELCGMEKIVQMSLFSYNIGQLGRVSLFDLKFILNRSGLPPPLEFEGILKNRTLELNKSDPWFSFALYPEPRLLFVTTTCSESSPPLQVLNPELVKSQLQSAMREYLTNCVQINKDDNTITLPELLMWYRHDFSSEQETFTAEHEGVLHVVEGHTTGSTQTVLREMLQMDKVHGYSESIDTAGRKELPFKVLTYNYKYNFLVKFDGETHNLRSIPSSPALTFHKTHRRVTSLPKNLDLSFEHSGGSKKVPHMKYQLTPLTLEYIKDESPLVATLVSLVCMDELDDIEEHLNVDHFTGSLRSRSSSEMSLVDIKSYRYQRLTRDYPILNGHILSYVIPVAGAEDPEILGSADPILKFISNNISDSVKVCMLNLHTSKEFQSVLMKLLEDLTKEGKWLAVISLLEGIPIIVTRQRPQLCVLHDFALACCVTELVSGNQSLNQSQTDKVVCCMHKFIDKEKFIHLLLSVYKSLPLEECCELFDLVFYLQSHESLHSAVKAKIQELKMFLRITECAKTLQFKISSGTSFDKMDKSDIDSLEQLTEWRNVQSPAQASTVLSVLLRTGDYETARQWCGFVKFPEQKYLDVVEHQLFTLLENSKSDTTKSFMILEELKQTNEKDCYRICENLLGKLTNQKDRLFVVTYMMEHLTGVLTEERVDELHQTKIGCDMLLCMPENFVHEYCHLVAEPKLMLEQLLMNMKVELASTAFQKVHFELEKLRNVGQRFTQQDFNTLIAEYATKALEFIVIQYTEPEKDRSQSQQSISSNASSDKLDGAPDKSPTKRTSLTESVRVRRSIDYTDFLNKYSKTKGKNRSFLSNSPNIGSPVMRATRSNKFVMPAEPPPKEKWQPDSATQTCMVCQVERFSMFNRRHHCRRCGRVVCSSCSTKTSQVSGMEVRTCDDCYSQLFSPRKPEVEIYQQSSDNLSGSSLTSRTFGSNFPIIPEHAESLNLTDAMHHSELIWKLKPGDADHNKMVREDFYYEQAPSTSLCLSLLGLHSKPHKCGKLMLDLCDNLSEFLRPIAPGVPNPEVDYSLVLSMMKTLLVHAKMQYINIGDPQGLVRCETYQSHIDLLGILVGDNYTDLPTLQELTKKDYVTRMRDKLIQVERLHLAVEVSTKCGLDPAGVWAAWGMNCLLDGDFPSAREKFSRCLKPLTDRNKVIHPPKLLADVIDFLESTPSSVTKHLQLMKTKRGTWQDLLADPLMMTEEGDTDTLQYHECHFYLKTYASFYTIINFHRRNGRWMKAVQYILDQKCSKEVFVESLLIPALNSGELGKLTDQMVMLDPSLEKWNPYLTAICRHLVKNRLHHVLYEFQIFMKDYIRAAMTCINYFYQEGANSYLDLYTRISYLHTALRHMQSYLDPSEWGSVRRPTISEESKFSSTGQSSDPVRLIQSPEEVSRYIRTVSIQIEVTKHLYHCLTNPDPEATVPPPMSVSGRQYLPTMFGNTKTRTDLVNMVLLSGNDISTAFELSYKIIKEYKLGGTAIFTHVAREMAKAHRYAYVRSLLDAIARVGYGDEDTVDEIVGACILVISKSPNEAKEAENLIKLLKKDSNKINAYILCGKLRSAYLMAVKTDRVDDVQRIAGAAQRMGQTAVKNICTKWLQQKGKQ
ncbi:zinc finger FYVE domain-containing protein 26-like [Saccostrea cucullata]|uniref:zinc finger FYVE domain-containing protein 26-like n=1 Tax=Saccostrea cuccullata TaxID=36930 RepID=UPI002ED4FC94